jgi:hypothetical protein
MQNTLEQSLIDALPIGAAIFTGPEHTIKSANEEMLNNWDKDRSVIGKDLNDAIPEIQDQLFLIYYRISTVQAIPFMTPMERRRF